jgi:carbon storage regulator CsrA
MLVLSRKVGERIMLAEQIVITVTAIRGARVRLGITAPPEVPIRREGVAAADGLAAEASGVARRPSPAAAAGQGRPPCVLVADDDESVRHLLAKGLRAGGFDELLAATGREAVERYREDPAAVAVVLLDVQMPGVSRPEALAALRRLTPEVRCCFMTGGGPYTENGLLGLGAARVFAKPFALVEVVQTLRRLAENAGPRA